MNTANLSAQAPPHPNAQGSELCLSCGLCCQGMLHRWVRIAADEVERANHLGMSVYIEGEGYASALPCPNYRCSRCQIYSRRPRACRKYQCRLLQDYLAGRTSLEKALQLVQRAHDLKQAIQQHIGNRSGSQRIWAQVKDFARQQELEKLPEASRRAHDLFLFDVATLLTLCRRRFRCSDSKEEGAR